VKKKCEEKMRRKNVKKKCEEKMRRKKCEI